MRYLPKNSILSVIVSKCQAQTELTETMSIENELASNAHGKSKKTFLQVKTNKGAVTQRSLQRPTVMLRGFFSPGGADQRD